MASNGTGTAGSDSVTEALRACWQDDEEAFNRLVSMVYDHLRRIAHRQLQRYRPGQTLNTTGLVHETYLQLRDQAAKEWVDRAHLYAFFARAMRQIIIDYAKRRSRQKRGGGAVHLHLDGIELTVRDQAGMLLELNELLDHLARIDSRVVRVVECRFFAGLTEEETAQALDVTARTVQRDWKKAKAWLQAELAGRQVP